MTRRDRGVRARLCPKREAHHDPSDYASRVHHRGGGRRRRRRPGRRGAGQPATRIGDRTPHASARAHGTASVDSLPGRLAHRRRSRTRRGHSHHARRDRRGHDLLRQLLGLPRRRVRGGDGPRAGRRPAHEGVPHDEELRARLRGLEAVPRRQPAPPADRLPRPLAVSRDGLRQRSGLGVRQGRHPGRHRGAEGRQGPPHRVHRPQGPAHSPGHAREALRVGDEPDAHQRARLPLPQFPETRRPRLPEEAGGSHRHEGIRRRAGHAARRPGCRRPRPIATRSASRWRRRSSA